MPARRASRRRAGSGTMTQPPFASRRSRRGSRRPRPSAARRAAMRARAPEPDVTGGVAALDPAVTLVGPEEPAQELPLDLDGRHQNARRQTLLMGAGARHPQAPEEVAHRAAARSQQDRAVRHRLPRDALDQFPEKPLARGGRSVRDVVPAVHPPRLHIGEPAVSHQMAEAARRALRLERWAAAAARPSRCAGTTSRSAATLGLAGVHRRRRSEARAQMPFSISLAPGSSAGPPRAPPPVQGVHSPWLVCSGRRPRPRAAAGRSASSSVRITMAIGRLARRGRRPGRSAVARRWRDADALARPRCARRAPRWAGGPATCWTGASAGKGHRVRAYAEAGIVRPRCGRAR